MLRAWLMPTATATLNRYKFAVVCEAAALRAWASGFAWRVLHRAAALCLWVEQQSCASVGSSS